MAKSPKSNGDVQAAERRDVLTRFKPGQVANPKGRPKGSRNKLGEQFVAAVQADFEQHGPETIIKVREERPHEYLKLIAGMLPSELNVKVNNFGDISDEDLAGFIEAVRRAIPASVPDDLGAGTAAKVRH